MPPFTISWSRTALLAKSHEERIFVGDIVKHKHQFTNPKHSEVFEQTLLNLKACENTVSILRPVFTEQSKILSS